MHWLHYDFLGNEVLAWLIAIGMVAVTWALLLLVRRIVRTRLVRLAQKTDSKWDDVAVEVLANTRQWFFFGLSVGAGKQAVALPQAADDAIRTIVVVGSLVQAGIWLQHGSRRALELWQGEKEAGGRRATLSRALGFALRLLIWSLILLLVLQNLGVQITALVAGLGVGGIAVGLALQNVMSDLFASLSIYTDRPFDIGDSISVGDFAGTVDAIGWRSTRLTGLGGEQLIIFNGDITKSRIRNFKRMKERRVLFEIGIVYSTPYAKVREVAPMLRAIISRAEDIRFDRAHFKRYGEYALVFEVVYFVLSPDYNVFMDRQESINLEIFRTLEEAGIELAYPTQTLHVRQEASR